jgi:hypothetical protein
MNFGEWEVRVTDNFDMMTVDVYMMRWTGAGKEVLTHDGKIVKIQNAVSARSDGLYFARLEREQLKALADGLANYGVKTDTDAKLQGTLEATRYHLEDMRAIALKTKRV